MIGLYAMGSPDVVKICIGLEETRLPCGGKHRAAA